MKIINGGITKPQGFKASGLCCGIRKSGKFDLGLIFSEVPCVAAGVFTKNSVVAAPLVISKKHLKNGKAQAMIVNSGNANCYTGELGLLHAYLTTEVIAKKLGILTTDVLVTSTGIIGKTLPYEKIEKAAEELVNSLSKTGSSNFEKAILTTDLIVKEKTVEITVAGKKVVIGGCAKGSGMIAPNMATMLGFVNTDVAISPKLLKEALAYAVELSFNRITVDGCMSTNDMVTIFANGKAGNKVITTKGKDFEVFQEALNFVCLDLAKKVVMDGEGATKFITVNVVWAKTQKHAHDMAMAVANSNLVKTAAFGCNPNWGRVAQAVGSLGIPYVNEKHMEIEFSPFDKKEISITVKFNQGKHNATVYTSDLSNEYVRINAEYN
ncbi:MAG: bifunctional glutamate N-acetyltransferase/amino-acid acetyltransferase ArgJ [Candidatus Omnitrophica bacterium]|nr:bifunctional glutamate N-acetyltransferase/amino-acid acetyltransferase ArgJ [Candidatus Omnitrophota bacterium]